METVDVRETDRDTGKKETHRDTDRQRQRQKTWGGRDRDVHRDRQAETEIEERGRRGRDT